MSKKNLLINNLKTETSNVLKLLKCDAERNVPNICIVTDVLLLKVHGGSSGKGQCTRTEKLQAIRICSGKIIGLIVF